MSIVALLAILLAAAEIEVKYGKTQEHHRIEVHGKFRATVFEKKA